MLKIKVNEEHVPTVKMNGAMPILCSDLIVGLFTMYNMIAENSQKDADEFKMLVKHAIEDDLPFQAGYQKATSNILTKTITRTLSDLSEDDLDELMEQLQKGLGK